MPPQGRAFLSHSHADAETALRVQAHLKAIGIDTFAYENELPYGESLADEIEAALEAADYLLVLLTPSSAGSHWVSRELGLALHLQQQPRRGRRPAIIGLISGPIPAMPIQARDFWTGLPTKSFDFAATRMIDTSLAAFERELRDIETLLLPQVTVINYNNHEHRRLLEESFECYEECFDPAERDSPEDIALWLETNANSPDSPWRELYLVLHVAGRVAGMAYLSIHSGRPWCFANYLAVRNGWRELDRAKWFVQRAVAEVKQACPQVRWITFEVEPTDNTALERAAAADAELAPLSEEFVRNVKALRRLTWYSTYEVSAVVGDDGKPIEYWQPSMTRARKPRDERQLILMARAIDDPESAPGADIPKLIDFIYDDLYADAYSRGSTKKPRYRTYLSEVKHRVTSKMPRRPRLGGLTIPPSVRRVLRKVRQSDADRFAL